MRTLLLIALLLPPSAIQIAAATPQQGQLDQLQSRLNDFGGLARYRADNEALAPPGPGVQRVVFFGDSITDSWGRGPAHGSFFPGRPYVNRGISGQTTPQMLVRFQQDVVHLLPAAVVILAGTNDIAANTGVESLPTIEDNFRSMVAIAKAAHIRVILASILPADHYPWRPGILPAAPIRELNAWLAAYSQAEHLVFLNYYPALATPTGAMRPELAEDQAVHPNAAGYNIMQPLAEGAIAKALAAPAP